MAAPSIQRVVTVVQHEPVDPSPDPEHGSGGRPGGSYDSAETAVRLVIAWYNEQILREHRRSPAPDQQRLEELKARRQACLDDQRALEDASPEEAARIAADYAALLNELSDP